VTAARTARTSVRTKVLTIARGTPPAGGAETSGLDGAYAWCVTRYRTIVKARRTGREVPPMLLAIRVAV
jgi:hypothetical protein